MQRIESALQRRSKRVRKNTVTEMWRYFTNLSKLWCWIMNIQYEALKHRHRKLKAKLKQLSQTNLLLNSQLDVQRAMYDSLAIKYNKLFLNHKN